jgi:hypothetical protein
MHRRRQAITQRRASLQAGLELIAMGLGLPMIYVVGMMTIFTGVPQEWTAFVLTGSALCFILGVTAIWRSR